MKSRNGSWRNRKVSSSFVEYWALQEVFSNDRLADSGSLLSAATTTTKC